MALEARAGILSLSVIAWSAYSVAVVSISSYGIDMGKPRPSFQCESMSRSLSVHQSINSDNYEYAISLSNNNMMLIQMFFVISLLVSGSDDFNIIVWEAVKYKLGCTINSGHFGNIFSVKVSPDSIKRLNLAPMNGDLKLFHLLFVNILQQFYSIASMMLL